MSVYYHLIKSLDLDPAALGSMEVPPKSNPPAPVKHRACDECRTRKLACSKDADGCERCKREKIVCHYSEQKQMGRPRKRQFVEAAEPEQVLDDDPFNSGAALYSVNTTASDKKPEGPDLVVMDQLMQAAAPYIYGVTEQNSNVPSSRWNFGGNNGEIIAGPPINFDENVGPTDGPPPQLSGGSNASGSEADSPPQAPTSCSCLASMYLALSSLQQIPTDIVTALKTVRGAAQAAAHCIWCPVCGAVVLDNPNPPMESFQNTMMLGTLLPVIANAYRRLLQMVDQETAEAEAAGTTKTFRFHDYGGLCGDQSSLQEALTCIAKDMFFNAVEMPPLQWRTTVRALLRVDIYGHEQAGFKHKGLRDLITDMELRQKTRHDLLEAHIASGNAGHGLFNENCNNLNGIGVHGQVHTCLQILSIAKVAIDNLIIA